MKSLIHTATGREKIKFGHPNITTVKKSGMLTRCDGTETRDKTWGLKSKPGKKQQMRQANRSMNKAARQYLSKLTKSELEQTNDYDC